MPNVAPDKSVRSIGGVVLAAGRSRRFGADNKLLAPLKGMPLLWHVLDSIAASRARPIVIVTGHERELIEASLRDYRQRRRRAPHWRLIFNPRYRFGLSTSLKAGLGALPASIEGAVIALGDMPDLRADLVDALIDAFQPTDDAVVPVTDGRRANPVLLGRPLFELVQKELVGDEGAKRLLQDAARVREITADRTATLDIDTRRDLREYRSTK